MPRSPSELTLQQRKARARERFAMGFNNEQIAAELSVHATTVGEYRKEYEADLGAHARANPELLRDVLANTIRSLDELDLVRQRAWDELEASRRQHRFECPECGHAFSEVSGSGAATRNQLLNTIVKAQEQRGKLLGLFGVKQEFFLHVQQVRVVQDQLLSFMAAHLCDDDKRKLESLLTGELSGYLSASTQLPVITVGSEQSRVTTN